MGIEKPPAKSALMRSISRKRDDKAAPKSKKLASRDPSAGSVGHERQLLEDKHDITTTRKKVVVQASGGVNAKNNMTAKVRRKDELLATLSLKGQKSLLVP